MPRITSTGQCNICNETFSKQAMTRHLTKCRSGRLPLKGKPRKTFHLLAQGDYLPEYWLHVEAPAAAALQLLDAFLRDIWLECCGHLSAFTIAGVRYEMDTGGIDGMWSDIFGSPQPTQSMSARMDSVLRPGVKFFHEYDFGTTTTLALKVVAEQESVLPKDAINILARNHPPPIPCGKCGQPATDVCVECMDSPDGWLCESHAAKHKHDEMFLPVVNSPRVGQCGYTGGG